jgi:hypothetical protein
VSIAILLHRWLTRALQLTSAVVPIEKWFRFARGLSRRASFDAVGAARAPVGVVASGPVVAGARS